MQPNSANIRRPPTVVACAAETNRRAPLGLPGGVMVASASPKAQLVSPFLSVDSQLQEIAKTVIR